MKAVHVEFKMNQPFKKRGTCSQELEIVKIAVSVEKESWSSSGVRQKYSAPSCIAATLRL